MVQLQKEVSQLTQPTQTNIIHILIKETRNSNVFFLKFLFRLTCLCLKQIHRCQCSASTNKLMVQYTFISSCIPWLSNPCVLYCSAMLYCNVHHAVCFYCLYMCCISCLWCSWLNWSRNSFWCNRRSDLLLMFNFCISQTGLVSFFCHVVLKIFLKDLKARTGLFLS